jgi:hypothetical protein
LAGSRGRTIARFVSDLTVGGMQMAMARRQAPARGVEYAPFHPLLKYSCFLLDFSIFLRKLTKIEFLTEFLYF